MIRFVASTIFVTVCIDFAFTAFYESDSNVVDLTSSNFQSRVVDSDKLWVVEFYAPWCGHCQALAPEYKKAATALKGVVNVGAVNMDEHQSVGSPYNIRGFPTIKIFGADKSRPTDYNGARTAEGLVDKALDEASRLVRSRLGGKRSDSGSGREMPTGDKKDVIELTDGNFEELVLNSEEMWLVEFFAPWCGHCKNLAPHWASAATQLKGKVKLGALDATVHTVLAHRFGVQGYPTIKYFAAGKKTREDAQDYDGGRTASDIVSWANAKLAENVPPPDVVQITSEAELKEACESHPLCIIAILPHILDCQSGCRNGHLETLRKLGERFKKNLWGWVWAEAMSQPDLEESLGIGGFGYPAMAALNARKMKYTILKGSFGYDGISEFLKELAYGRGSPVPLRGSALPKVKKAQPWDGKDGEMPVEDEVDLSKQEL